MTAETSDASSLRARLVTSQEYDLRLTDHATCDAPTAILEALADYLSAYVHPGTSKPLFGSVYVSWATPSDRQDFPSAVVALNGRARADNDRLLPGTEDDLGPAKSTGVVLRSPTGYTASVRLEVVCTNPEQRKVVGLALEKALNPVAFMSGFRLQIPEYYNAIADYLPGDVGVVDSPSAAAKRTLAHVTLLQASIPEIVPHRTRKMAVRVTRLDD